MCEIFPFKQIHNSERFFNSYSVCTRQGFLWNFKFWVEPLERAGTINHPKNPCGSLFSYECKWAFELVLVPGKESGAIFLLNPKDEFWPCAMQTYKTCCPVASVSMRAYFSVQWSWIKPAGPLCVLLCHMVLSCQSNNSISSNPIRQHVTFTATANYRYGKEIKLTFLNGCMWWALNFNRPNNSIKWGVPAAYAPFVWRHHQHDRFV